MDLKSRIIAKRVNSQFTRLNRSLSCVGLTLGDWQVDGIRWMLNREQDHRCRGGFLFDDMGLGKTIETIGLMIGNMINKKITKQPIRIEIDVFIFINGIINHYV